MAPPKLGADDGWAAELDKDESWEGLEQKPAAGKVSLQQRFGINVGKIPRS